VEKIVVDLIMPFSAYQFLRTFQRYSRSKSRVIQSPVHCW